jgi:hypothetical protein
MGLREEIEAAFGEAAAEGGVRLLSIDGDDEVWVAGLGATDGTLEVRVGDRGPRRALRRRRPDEQAMRAQGFREGCGPPTSRSSCRASTSTATSGSPRARSSPTRPSPPPGPPSKRSGSARAIPCSSISAPERPSALLVIPPA